MPEPPSDNDTVPHPRNVKMTPNHPPTDTMLTDLEKNAIRDHYQNIGKNLPGFRPRASQREMIAAVANAFSRTLTREEGGEPPKREGESIAVIEGNDRRGQIACLPACGRHHGANTRQAADCEQRDGCLAGAVGRPRPAVSGRKKRFGTDLRTCQRAR